MRRRTKLTRGDLVKRFRYYRILCVFRPRGYIRAVMADRRHIDRIYALYTIRMGNPWCVALVLNIPAGFMDLDHR